MNTHISLSSPGSQSISEIVKSDYRTADVFKKWGISYCCGGFGTFDEVCRLQKINRELLMLDLHNATQNNQVLKLIPQDWPLDFLVDYLINIQHAYTFEALRNLDEHLNSYVPSHLKKYPYLQEVHEAFNTLRDELNRHMKEEETIIFPYIKQVNHAFRHQDSYGNLFVRTLRKSIVTIINVGHPRIESYRAKLRVVTGDYIFPPAVCTNHQVIYKKLKELDTELTELLHLENDILFTKANIMENELLKS